MPHNDESHQISENLDTESSLKHSMCHVWASWKIHQHVISFSKTVISQSCISKTEEDTCLNELKSHNYEIISNNQGLALSYGNSN